MHCHTPSETAEQQGAETRSNEREAAKESSPAAKAKSNKHEEASAGWRKSRRNNRNRSWLNRRRRNRSALVEEQMKREQKLAEDDKKQLERQMAERIQAAGHAVGRTEAAGAERQAALKNAGGEAASGPRQPAAGQVAEPSKTAAAIETPAQPSAPSKRPQYRRRRRYRQPPGQKVDAAPHDKRRIVAAA